MLCYPNGIQSFNILPWRVVVVVEEEEEKEEEEEEHFKLLLKGKGDVLPLGGDLRHDAK